MRVGMLCVPGSKGIDGMQQTFQASRLVPRGFVVADMASDGGGTSITVRLTAKASTCPGCGTRSERVHSRYRRRLAAAIKARWVCEQAHQQLKGELGLDHFEGRSWTGLHRHALMTCIAYAVLQHLRLAGHGRAGRGKKADPAPGTAPITQPACRTAGHHGQTVRQPRSAHPVPVLPAPLQPAF